jgi:hypothetical protein
MNVAMDKIVSDPRQVSIIRQTCLKCSAEIVSSMINKGHITDEISKETISIAKDLFHYVLHGEQWVEIPDIDLDKYIKKEDK